MGPGPNDRNLPIVWHIWEQRRIVGGSELSVMVATGVDQRCGCEQVCWRRLVGGNRRGMWMMRAKQNECKLLFQRGHELQQVLLCQTTGLQQEISVRVLSIVKADDGWARSGEGGGGR
uniref:Uncharacterized protein n=1 Tax=Eutreptiella gymnastica TaxID=73025 RepID=A0A7S1IWH1_9EUGL|mmetsp:Transcript_47071/g.84291  ORF Transcript_47071/g.84291 Transcript_47071/m.84291 type:complete len:118 (+) Transcript_47071:542-895(+)